MLMRRATLLVGVFVVLTALMAGAGGDCDLNSADDCLFFCS